MIIDTHNHPIYHGHDVQKMLENMDANHIDKTWLLSWEAPRDEYDPNTIYAFGGPIESEYPVPFTACLRYAREAPDRFILGYAPDPRKPDAVQKLRCAMAVYGVKVCGEVKLRMMYDNPDAIDLFRFCGENGLPVVLHFDNASAQLTGKEFPRRHWWYGGDIDTLERVLKLCPDTNFLGHAPGFWCHISDDDLGATQAYPKGPVIPGGRIEQLLDKYPNLYCDCSAGSARNALTRDTDYTVRLINAHPDRFCFARDYFDSDLAKLLETLPLSAEVKEMIYYKNAENLIK